MGVQQEAEELLFSNWDTCSHPVTISHHLSHLYFSHLFPLTRHLSVVCLLENTWLQLLGFEARQWSALLLLQCNMCVGVLNDTSTRWPTSQFLHPTGESIKAILLYSISGSCILSYSDSVCGCIGREETHRYIHNLFAPHSVLHVSHWHTNTQVKRMWSIAAQRLEWSDLSLC